MNHICKGNHLQPCDQCLEGEIITCEDCGLPVRGHLYATMDGPVCEACYDARPWYSVCCGHNPCGVELDMGLCGDCHDHCEYEK